MLHRIEELHPSEVRYYSMQYTAYKQIPEEQFNPKKMKTIGFYYKDDGKKMYFILNVNI